MIFIQVFERLQKLNVCVCHRTTVRLVNLLGSDYDAKVYQWRELLIDDLEDDTVVSVMSYMQQNSDYYFL